MTSIGDMLVDAGLKREHLEECRALARQSGDSLDRLVLQREYLDEVTLLQVYAKHLGFEFRKSLEGTKVPEDYVDRVPVHFARNYNLVALDRSADDVLKVATCTPLEPHPMDDLAALMGSEVDAVLAPRLEITNLIGRAYRHKADGVDEALDAVAEDGDIGSLAAEIDEAEDVLDVSNKAPIIKLVNTILFQALKMRASDVHFQCYAERMQVRFRIDGILYDMDSIPRRVQDAIISRVKVMGKMDIAERRLPQDGRTTIKVGDGEVDVRISSVPTSQGERIVFRLLDKTARLYTLNEIGLGTQDLDLTHHYLNYSHGIILITGPTGSGKTTTLYAGLAEIDSDEKNVITIEDPIEYNIDGISQIQVANKKGLTFASGLRSLMRQDPDVMMVGEIRDGETAGIAVQAANTGHLVFSTLHTNDSAGAISRMVNLGVEPYLVASAVIAVVAQRLVRLICPSCKKPYEPTEAQLKELNCKDRSELHEGMLYLGEGCDSCLGRGLYDRTAIYEIFGIDEQARDEIIQRISASVMKQNAVTRGLRTLRMDGSRKVKEGRTTIEEVFRVTQLDVF
ncbi:MAG: ATPase, T2SS/T4P/T4SS family [Planctomycetota bacterium]